MGNKESGSQQSDQNSQQKIGSNPQMASTEFQSMQMKSVNKNDKSNSNNKSQKTQNQTMNNNQDSFNNPFAQQNASHLGPPQSNISFNQSGKNMQSSFNGKNSPNIGKNSPNNNNSSFKENDDDHMMVMDAIQQQKVDEFKRKQSRRKSVMGGSQVLQNTTDTVKLANRVKELNFFDELPSKLDLIDFYRKNNLPPLNLFPDLPENYKETFMMVNIARTQPQMFASSYLEKFRNRFVNAEGQQGGNNATTYVTVDKSKVIQTYEAQFFNIIMPKNQTFCIDNSFYEGLYPLEECITKLRKMKPLEPLHWSHELYCASKDHADDIGPLGLYGHDKLSLGLNMYDRIRCFSDKEPGMLTENVAFGSYQPLEALILMFIDDGDIQDRKMRENLLDPAVRYIGFSTGKHKFQTAMLCFEFLDKNEVRYMHEQVKYTGKQYQLL